MSFKHEKRRDDTELSKHLWELKEKKNLQCRGRSSQKPEHIQISPSGAICLHEKYFIISNPQMATLNKRNELVSSCRHRRKYILKYNWIVNWTANQKRAHVIFEFLNALLSC